MDGRITALDPSADGAELWSMSTAPGDMLSSTISELQITNQVSTSITKNIIPIFMVLIY